MRRTVILGMLTAAAPGVAAWSQPATRVATSPAAVAPLRTLITTDLEKREVRLVEWTRSGVRFADANVPEELAADAAGDTLPASKVLAMVAPWRRVAPASAQAWPVDEPASRAEAASRQVRVTLVDGQRLIGTLAGGPGASAAAEQDSVRVNAGVLGEIRVKLDDIAVVEVLGGAIRGGSAGVGAPTTGADTVMLANGDRVTGFVESIGEQVVVSVESTGQAPAEVTRVPLGRCRSVTLANARTFLSGSAVWIAADGGEMHVVRASRLSASPVGETAFDVAADRVQGPGVVVGTPLVLAVAPEASRLVGLATLGMPRYRADASRRWTDPPRIDGGVRSPLGLGEVVFPGAMSAEWTLPGGVTAISGSILLAPEARLWGECTVELRIEGARGREVVWKGDLDSEHHRREIAVELAKFSGRTGEPTGLGITIGPGRLGGIQDRVVLEGFMLIRSGGGPGEGGSAR